MINNMADFTKLNASMPFIAFNRAHFFTAYTQDNKMGMKMVIEDTLRMKSDLPMQTAMMLV